MLLRMEEEGSTWLGVLSNCPTYICQTVGQKEKIMSIRSDLQERKIIRKHIKWEDPFTSLIWSVVRKKRLQGRIFRCEHRIPGIRGREILATLYCSKYRFILEPLTGRYTYAQKRQDRFLYERG
jgi:hypothetical protein